MFLRNRLVFCGLWSLWAVAAAPQAPADIMDVDVSQVPVAYRSAFLQAEQFWEGRLTGFSPLLPRFVQGQLDRIQVTATVTGIDGAGGVLGQAGPTDTYDYQDNRRRISISQAANMEFDEDDMDFLVATGLLDDVVRHEMAHALGFGSLWTANALNTAVNGNYRGGFGLKQYRIESGNTYAPYVPVEQQGGGGTAGAHWDSADPFFLDPIALTGELMIGFITEEPWVSETTWASMADLWFRVTGINDRVTGGVPIPPGPKQTPTAVPEPGTWAALAGLALVGWIGCRRKRSA